MELSQSDPKSAHDVKKQSVNIAIKDIDKRSMETNVVAASCLLEKTSITLRRPSKTSSPKPPFSVHMAAVSTSLSSINLRTIWKFVASVMLTVHIGAVQSRL